LISGNLLTWGVFRRKNYLEISFEKNCSSFERNLRQPASLDNKEKRIFSFDRMDEEKTQKIVLPLKN